MTEKVRLRIGSLARAVLITGQAYQDPKDALNEFVSNAADEYAEAGMRGERVRVILRRRGRYPMVAIDDEGRGMTDDRLREVARSLFKSVKVDDDRTLGEKAIGLLAFQQLGGRMDIVSRAEGSNDTWCLRLERGKTTADLSKERRRARTTSGTTVYLAELDAEVLRTITQRKVVDYLRQRRGPAIARGDYVLEVQEGRTSEIVSPERPEGVRVPLGAQRTLWGTIEYNLYVNPEPQPRRRVAVVGRAGTTILDSITEIEEFDDDPWNSGHVAGEVIFPGLQQTAGRRAILRDDDSFPVFAASVEGVVPTVVSYLDRVRSELDRRTTDRLQQTIHRVFRTVLRELDDLDNPMRSAAGSEHGVGGLLVAAPESTESDPNQTPSLDEIAPPPPPAFPDLPDQEDEPPAKPEGNRNSRLPSIAPDPDPGSRRSRFDPDERVVYYSEIHPDYLLAKDDEVILLDYLATLVSKEYVVYNNPRAAPDEVSEELVRMMVRVRRHLPRRR